MSDKGKPHCLHHENSINPILVNVLQAICTKYLYVTNKHDKKREI